MKGFTVIDKLTGQYPDCEKIALNEDWASNLIYCDIEGFSLQEDGNLILLDECGNYAYCPPDRFEIVFDEDNPWLVRTPTEDGWYWIVDDFNGHPIYGSRQFSIEGGWGQGIRPKAWQKIKPYKGENK